MQSKVLGSSADACLVLSYIHPRTIRPMTPHCRIVAETFPSVVRTLNPCLLNIVQSSEFICSKDFITITIFATDFSHFVISEPLIL